MGTSSGISLLFITLGFTKTTILATYNYISVGIPITFFTLYGLCQIIQGRVPICSLPLAQIFHSTIAHIRSALEHRVSIRYTPIYVRMVYQWKLQVPRPLIHIVATSKSVHVAAYAGGSPFCAINFVGQLQNLTFYSEKCFLVFRDGL